MPLFHVQDADRPMYVIGDSYHEAIQAWLHIIAIENEMDVGDVEPPLGINYLCPDDELITFTEKVP